MRAGASHVLAPPVEERRRRLGLERRRRLADRAAPPLHLREPKLLRAAALVAAGEGT